MTVLLSLILVHLLADFPLQTRRMAQLKHRHRRILFQHLAVHASLMLLVLAFFVIRGQLTLDIAGWLGGSILVFHALLDASPLKRRVKQAAAYWIDQALHIAAIIALTWVFVPIDWSLSFGRPEQVLWILCFSLVTTELLGHGIALMLAPFAPRLIEAHFERKVTRKEQLDGVSRTVTHEVEDSARSYTTELNGIGRYIGLVERAIITLLVVTNATGAIGFIIALKALARFKQFEDRRFAEYYIIGSLLSILGAILCGLAIRAAL
ncbi:DUF3307 domain-containing protein [Exiguobacterium sp. OS-77]|uniref:DUF3307 domain-containing protein n=1 Tax=Exiguobacterium sp. OS-77 TaxID=1241306 RepID=UPI000405FA48|nr:DUF3307 domain-containing protein [Exiguobacterium sp. OS-77]